jgi:hypothetical protein
MTKLDDIFERWWIGQTTSNGLGVVGERGRLRSDAKETVKSLMLGLIGADDYPDNYDVDEVAGANQLRAELRAKIEAL